MGYVPDLGIYIHHPMEKYVEFTNGKVVKRNEIPNEHYELLKEWGEVKREFFAERR